MTRRYLITSALPYVNNVPHLGNLIGSTLSADFYSRYCRTQNRQVLFIGGSDCYGTASEIKARQEGTTPAELCDKYHAIHQRIYKWFNISFDVYGKTSTPTHTEIVKQISEQLDANGYLQKRVVEQLYCETCQMSLADRFVVGECPHCNSPAKGDQCDASDCGKILHAINLVNPKCVVCGTSPKLKDSVHVFLDLGKCQPTLEKWAENNDGWTSNAIAITRDWLKRGLEPRCITRDLKWGTPVPHLQGQDWNDKVFYVWYDAPIGYISITAAARADWRGWWNSPDTKMYQFMAKDNIQFHTVMFPAILQAAGQEWTTVTNVCATEYLNYEGSKFSKSNNVGIFCDQAVASGIPADYWRYYLATIRPERSDSNFDRTGFKLAINELADKFGNLVHRVLTLIKKYRNGRPLVMHTMSQIDITHRTVINSIVKDYHDSFDAVKIPSAVQLAMQVAQETNRYLYECEPWKIKDDPTRRDAVCSEVLRSTITCSYMLAPIIPSIHAQFCEYLNYTPSSITEINFNHVCIDKFKPLIDKKILEQF